MAESVYSNKIIWFGIVRITFQHNYIAFLSPFECKIVLRLRSVSSCWGPCRRTQNMWARVRASAREDISFVFRRLCYLLAAHRFLVLRSPLSSSPRIWEKKRDCKHKDRSHALSPVAKERESLGPRVLGKRISRNSPTRWDHSQPPTGWLEGTALD